MHQNLMVSALISQKQTHASQGLNIAELNQSPQTNTTYEITIKRDGVVPFVNRQLEKKKKPSAF